jgi:hypothetical protein
MESQGQRQWGHYWEWRALNESILVALISGGLSLLGVLISNAAAVRKNETAIRMAQAVTDAKVETLTAEVREHNHFAQRMPVVEEQIKVINHRIADLEVFHRPVS